MSGVLSPRLKRLALRLARPYQRTPSWLRGMAQPGSAAVLGTAGRRFESCCPDQKICDLETGWTDMTAKIFRPARTAMQSGAARTKQWLLEFEPEQPRSIEPLMGWTSTTETRTQLKLWFDTKEEAIAYAERHAIPYRVNEPQALAPRVMSYSDNFKVTRFGQWTH